MNSMMIAPSLSTDAPIWAQLDTEWKSLAETPKTAAPPAKKSSPAPRRRKTTKPS